jgi:hypothetical protein
MRTAVITPGTGGYSLERTGGYSLERTGGYSWERTGGYSLERTDERSASLTPDSFFSNERGPGSSNMFRGSSRGLASMSGEEMSGRSRSAGSVGQGGMSEPSKTPLNSWEQEEIAVKKENPDMEEEPEIERNMVASHVLSRWDRFLPEQSPLNSSRSELLLTQWGATYAAEGNCGSSRGAGGLSGDPVLGSFDMTDVAVEVDEGDENGKPRLERTGAAAAGASGDGSDLQSREDELSRGGSWQISWPEGLNTDRYSHLFLSKSLPFISEAKDHKKIICFVAHQVVLLALA